MSEILDKSSKYRDNIKNSFTITAHAGALGTKPNTLSSLKKAIEFGVDIVEVDLTFRPDGTPIRAVATVRFKSSIEEQIRAARENNSSPDLTHVRKVKAGDTLPLMCYGIYGNPAYYLQVAAANGLSDFRSLKPGTDIFFPPIEKTR